MTPAWRSTFLYGLPVLTTSFMLAWPGALQITFAFTSLLSLFQARLLQQPGVRNWLGIQPLPKPKSRGSQSESRYSGTMNRYQPPSPSAPAAAPKGVLGGAISNAKGAVDQMLKTARNLQDPSDLQEKTGPQRRTPAELKRAQAYEEKRQREIKGQQETEGAKSRWKQRRTRHER